MATYVNNLRLKEIATGAESGTWGTSTNTNLELIADGLGYGTKQVAADSNETFTMPDATADGTRAMYLLELLCMRLIRALALTLRQRLPELFPLPTVEQIPLPLLIAALQPMFQELFLLPMAVQGLPVWVLILPLGGELHLQLT